MLSFFTGPPISQSSHPRQSVSEGTRFSTKMPLGHFTYLSPNFYKGGQLWNLASVCDPICPLSLRRSKRSNMSELSNKPIDATTIGSNLVQLGPLSSKNDPDKSPAEKGDWAESVNHYNSAVHRLIVLKYSIYNGALVYRATCQTRTWNRNEMRPCIKISAPLFIQYVHKEWERRGCWMVKIHFQLNPRWRTAAVLKMAKSQ